MVVKGGGWQDFSLEPRVYAWGWSDKGQLGAPQRPGEQGMSCIGPLKFIDRVFKDSVDPATGHLVQNLIHEVDYTHTVCTVAAGLDHSVALTSEGMVFAWGDNSEGQCGLGHRLLAVRHPTLIPTIRNNGIKLKSIAAGPRQTGAVSMDGKALMWGAAHFVRLPTVVPDSHSYTPRGVPLDAKYEALQICCSSGFNILRTAGTSGVLGWGRNESGQLGQGPEDKKSRDLPIFIPLPATPAHSHVVSKVVVGTSFVVVSLQQASSFLYTWGALYVEEASEAAASGAGGVAGAKRSPGAQGSSKAAEVKAVCKPTRVEHPLWKDDAVIDISATGSEVLFESRVVHGYSWLEVLYTQRASAPAAATEERAPAVQSFFFKKAMPQPKAQEAPKEDLPSCVVERLRGEFTLKPCIYSLRHLKPLRMCIRSVHGTGNAVSLSFSWAKAVRPTKQSLESMWASIEVPPKIKEKAQKKHKELMDDSARLLSSPLLSRENQSRQSAKPAAETLVPDARLLHRMRSIYGTGSAKGRLGAFGYDYENDES
ncbi:IQ calmodulin-binding motif domain-containing protein [Cyclospora cayetanensis]|uniref:IQ calmodulin-binding motif domain-containing protein n=1 Tax=Cyclospora cayetanensis TaxID=88456 RepID=A0A1D3CWF7_9EIME|nr:IQ calmodulin-binding motif domain-containing protein [Cyclospora cayetanensis]